MIFDVEIRKPDRLIYARASRCGFHRQSTRWKRPFQNGFVLASKKHGVTMSSVEEPLRTPKAVLLVGWILSILPSLMLVMSAVMKFVKPTGFAENFGKLGFPIGVADGLGIVELASTALYVIPQTSVLGAILLTGYLGGATAAHVRLDEPFLTPVIIGMVLWGGLYLRDYRIRSLIPLRRHS
jgi:hypothetical protein